MNSLHIFLRQSRVHIYGAILFCVGISLMLAGFVPDQGMREMRFFIYEATPIPSDTRPNMSPDMRPTDATPWHILQTITPMVPPISTLTTNEPSYLALLEHAALREMQKPLTIASLNSINLPFISLEDHVPEPFTQALLAQRQCAPSAETRTLVNKLVAKNKTISNLYARRADKYKQWVRKYAKQYKINPTLIYAIIQAESSFKPTLISNREAHGLMQVVPSSAGKEVHKWLGLQGKPSPIVLLSPATNIKYGTTYLYLLLTRHLGKVETTLTREYLAIAAYNMGINAMFRTFAPTKDEAIDIINTMTPEEVYAYLQANMPARETRNYLKKVIANIVHFSEATLVAAY